MDVIARQASPVVEDERTVHDLAHALSALTRETGTQAGATSLHRLLQQGASTVMGARWGSVVVLRRRTFRTTASTGEAAAAIDSAQFRAGTGPGVDAVLHDATVLTPDICDDPRWQPLGPRLRTEVGLRSMVAYRLNLMDESEMTAGLTFGSDRPDAFSNQHVHRGLVLANHVALLIAAQSATTKADQLLKALHSNREIGVAVGVLMARCALTRQQAFDVLRAASQNGNRKLVDIATEVADTGLSPDDLEVRRSL